MNRIVIIGLCFTTLIFACSKDNSKVTPGSTAETRTLPATNSNGSNSAPHYAHRDSNDHSLFIPMSVANQMISSYVSSLSTQQNTMHDDLKSFSIDADSLRAYLANTDIKSIKLIFAHNMDYIDAGNVGKFSGLNSSAMTIIIAGYDGNGSYKYQSVNGVNNVLDHAYPCPYSCPSGDAGYDLLQ